MTSTGITSAAEKSAALEKWMNSPAAPGAAIKAKLRDVIEDANELWRDSLDYPVIVGRAINIGIELLETLGAYLESMEPTRRAVTISPTPNGWQECPTEEGLWWRACNVTVEAVEAREVLRHPASGILCVVLRQGDIAPIQAVAGVYWMLATIPAPPGENP